VSSEKTRQHRTELPIASCKTGVFFFNATKKKKACSQRKKKRHHTNLEHRESKLKKNTKKCETLNVSAVSVCDGASLCPPPTPERDRRVRVFRLVRVWVSTPPRRTLSFSDAWLAANRVSLLSVGRNRFPKHFEDHQKTEMRSSKHKNQGSTGIEAILC
jgi:hypothetical protein